MHAVRPRSALSFARIIGLAVLASGCSDSPVRAPAGDEPSIGTPRFAITPPPAASLTVQVTVPASMTSSPFNVDRFLTIPPNFSIAVFARVGGARFMAVAPNGDVLVSNPGAGAVYLLRPSTTGGDPSQFT